MSSDMLEHNQRIVFSALKKMTNDRGLIVDGFTYWFATLSDKPIDVNDCTGKFVEYLGLDGAQKKSLMVGLHVAANETVGSLPAVPEALLIRARSSVPDGANQVLKASSSNEVKKTDPPHCEVTTAYLKTMTQLLFKHDIESFSDLKGILSKEPLEDVSAPLEEAVRQWADNGLANLRIPIDSTEEDCKSIAHNLYLYISELVGPVEADELVDATIQIVKKMDFSSRFSPSLLL